MGLSYRHRPFYYEQQAFVGAKALILRGCSLRKGQGVGRHEETDTLPISHHSRVYKFALTSKWVKMENLDGCSQIVSSC